MKLSKERQVATGAFYTPKKRADLAVEYMKKNIEDFENQTFYDCACGEWALLESLWDVSKFWTTLEREDVKICRDKWYWVCRLDFLSNEAEDYLRWLREKENLVVYTNPPYFKLTKEQYPDLREFYWTNDSVELFYRRIIDIIRPKYLCGFNKCDLRQASSFSDFRQDLAFWWYKVKNIFLTDSKSRWLSWNFPIAFNIIYTPN